VLDIGPRIWWPSQLAREDDGDGFGPGGRTPGEAGPAIGNGRQPAPERITGT
jgi:hypothetical protein